MIELKNVYKTYSNGEVETKALIDINLKIKQGEVIVVLGASGSGKTTLLNVISGLDNLTSGTIYVNDKKISDYNEKRLTSFRRNNLGFVFQQYNLLQNLNVRENVEIGAAVSKNPLDIDEIIDRVDLNETKTKYPYQLSGGQQQRVSIARSLVKNPNFIFCDEPTGALDEETGKNILEILDELNRSYGTTIIMITHNPNISLMANRVIKMNSGKVVEIIENKERKSPKEITWA
ncbi:MAG TPA: ABC transporter ATP-binding protein [Anaerovoracaceae bacterium]|nr:ABC transporter ATP-binding protein [Anaerovoracaceae bacterium]